MFKNEKFGKENSSEYKNLKKLMWKEILQKCQEKLEELQQKQNLFNLHKRVKEVANRYI